MQANALSKTRRKILGKCLILMLMSACSFVGCTIFSFLFSPQAFADSIDRVKAINAIELANSEGILFFFPCLQDNAIILSVSKDTKVASC